MVDELFKISEDMDLEELVEQYPQVVRVLTEKGIICIQCGAPIWGTIGEAIRRAGQDVSGVIAEVNNSLT